MVYEMINIKFTKKKIMYAFSLYIFNKKAKKRSIIYRNPFLYILFAHTTNIASNEANCYSVTLISAVTQCNNASLKYKVIIIIIDLLIANQKKKTKLPCIKTIK